MEDIMPRNHHRIPVAITIGVLLSLGSATTASEAAEILSMRAPSPTIRSTPEGRVLIGRGKDYRPVAGDKDPQVLFDELMKNMKLRREFAWKIVDQLLQPTKIRPPGGNVEVDVPLWQTWYDGITGSGTGEDTDEIRVLFKTFFEKLKANPSADLSVLADQTLNEQAQKNLSTSLTVQKFTSVLRQNAVPDLSTEFGGQGLTMFSPSFVKHMMVSAKAVENCSHVGIKPDTPPPSPDNFSHCVKEFPRDAVMVKTSWKELSEGVAVHDTSAAAMTAVINEGTWPGGSHPTKKPTTIVPTSDQIYVNETEDGRRFGLTAVHLVTKDVREWVWVSLWWSPGAGNDFGADKPASIATYNGGVWNNYKMCVASAFDEGDPQPWGHYSGSHATLSQSIKAMYDAIQSHVDRGVLGSIIVGVPDSNFPPTARGPWAAPHNKNTIWCSNPFVELHIGNGRTSCIGCHQLVLTESRINSANQASFAEAILGHDPQFGRSRSFKNFSADFSWAFQGQYQPIIRSTREQVGFNWP
jgi:hypothetical protein